MKRLLAGYMLGCALMTVCCLLLLWMGLMASFRAGILLPANSGEQQAKQAAARMRESGVFTGAPPLCGYALLSEAGEVLETSLTGDSLRAALAYAGGEGNARGWFHDSASTAQGLCVLQYRYTVIPSGARDLNGPSWDLLLLIPALALLAMALAAMTALTARRLRRGLEPLTRAARVMASGNLDARIEDSPIREYNEALAALRAMQTELTASLAAQWRMERDREEQISALAHDLLTPLCIIRGNAQLLAEDALSPGQREAVRAMLLGCESAQEYVSLLRSLGERETPAPAELAPLIEQTNDFAAQVCAMREQTLRASSHAEGRAELCAGDVRRAVINLVKNASEHTPRGGAISIDWSWTGGALIVRVTDDGPGFSAEALERGKELAFTEHAERAMQGHMGMGLYYADGVARRHGGSLELANTPQGHGRATLALRVSR